MKKKFNYYISVIFLMFIVFSTNSQVITYSNFSQSLSETIVANIASNASFNNTLKTITGSGVVWDASTLMVSNGTPFLHLEYVNPGSTINGNLYPQSNYAFGDPSLTNIVGYEYYQLTSDSIVSWGYYDPSTSHEIFQNPDKRLIFPFTLNQSFVDNYNKTNYSNWNTISSYQNGTRSVTFAGFGTLILPQGSFSDVALITEIRTSNLGPDSYTYTWYKISNGKILLFREENNGNIRTLFCSEPISGIHAGKLHSEIHILPNPISEYAHLILPENLIQNHFNMLSLKIYNSLGEEVKNLEINHSVTIIKREQLKAGCYVYNISHNNILLFRGKIFFTD